MHPFRDPAETDILDRVYRCIPDERCVSIRFTAEIPPVRSLDQNEQWRRFKSIVHCQPVFDELGTMHGALFDSPDIVYAEQFATIGVLANILDDGGAWGAFLDDGEDPLTIAATIVRQVAHTGCDGLECYRLNTAWSDWFIGEGVCDTTFLMGRSSAWWLLAFTDTD